MRKVSPSSLKIGSNIFGLPAVPKMNVPPVPPPPVPSSRFDSAQADSETASAPASPIRATRRVRVSRNCCIWHPLGDVRCLSHRPVGQEHPGRSVCSPTLAGTRLALKHARLRSRYVGVYSTAKRPDLMTESNRMPPFAAAGAGSLTHLAVHTLLHRCRIVTVFLIVTRPRLPPGGEALFRLPAGNAAWLVREGHIEA